MDRIVNIAAYQFATLSDLKPLRARLLSQCKAWGLRGTILLSTEGINLFVAGFQPQVDELLKELRAISGLENLRPKVSESAVQPFTRMLVRIKKEIIAFGVPEIKPAEQPAPKLSPLELKQWLDEGRSITLLDTRNDYEVKLGTFNQAMSLEIDHFRQFPDAMKRLPEQLKTQPIVMFCTGGIRCEKAGPYMQREGFEQVFQLEGGILKYFEECGGKYYSGECFVFDQRVGVDPSLAETENTQCFKCLAPLTLAEQNDASYVPSVSCPYCFVTPVEQMVRNIAARELAIARAVNPLPGSQPYDNYRPVNISARHDGKTLLDALCDIFSHVSRNEWQSLCEQQRFVNVRREAVGPAHIVHAGDRYLHRLPATSEPDVNPNIRILHEDEAIVVVNKPAPLPLHPSGRFNRNSLQAFLNTAYRPQKLRPAHRLDANTTGVVVFTRTKHFAGRLQPQFSRGEVEKVYLARVHGHPSETHFSCDLPISNSPGEIGSREIAEDGLMAHTEFEVIERCFDGTSLLRVRPITGRTNQIRVHLWQLGWPICGDQAYLLNQQRGEIQTHAVDDPPLCLHAQQLILAHPLSGERMTFECETPSWVTNVSSVSQACDV